MCESRTVHYQPQQSVLKPQDGQRHTAFMRYISEMPHRSQIILLSLEAEQDAPEADVTGVMGRAGGLVGESDMSGIIAQERDRWDAFALPKTGNRKTRRLHSASSAAPCAVCRCQRRPIQTATASVSSIHVRRASRRIVAQRTPHVHHPSDETVRSGASGERPHRPSADSFSNAADGILMFYFVTQETHAQTFHNP